MQVAAVLAGSDEPGRHLLDDGEAELLEQRQEVGQRGLAAGLVELEARQRLGGSLLVLEGHDVGTVGAEALELLDVEGGLVDRGGGLVVVGEASRVPARELEPTADAELGDEGVRQGVVPAPCGSGHLLLKLGHRRVGDLARGNVDREVKPGRVGGERQGVIHGAAAEPQLEQVLEPDAKLGGDMVAREGDHGRHRPPHGVAPQEEAHAPLLLHPEQGHDRGAELRRGGREQLVLGEAVEERDDRLVVVRARDQVLPLHDRFELAADERDLARRLVVRLRREEPDQPQLADDLAPGVDALHADVVHPRLAVDGRLGVRLRHDHERPAEDPLTHRLVELGHGHRLCEPRPGLVREHAQARRRHDPGRRPASDLRHLVLAVAEVDEVVVGEPAQKLDRLVHLVGRVARTGGLGGLDHPLDPLDHRQEVANDEPQAREAP